MTVGCVSTFSRHDVPEVCQFIRPGGRGECRVPDAPAAARGEVVSTRVSHHGRTAITRHSRTRWGYGFLRALPGDRACLPPSLPGSRASQELDASVGASEPHDFAVRL